MSDEPIQMSPFIYVVSPYTISHFGCPSKECVSCEALLNLILVTSRTFSWKNLCATERYCCAVILKEQSSQSQTTNVTFIILALHTNFNSLSDIDGMILSQATDFVLWIRVFVFHKATLFFSSTFFSHYFIHFCTACVLHRTLCEPLGLHCFLEAE